MLLGFNVYFIEQEDIILHSGLALFFEIKGKVITQSFESLALFYFRGSLEWKA
jgi:hypothetical protein